MFVEDLKLLLKSQTKAERTGQHSQVAHRHSNRCNCSWESRLLEKRLFHSAFCLHDVVNTCWRRKL